MGVCKRTAVKGTVGTSFYAWQGWSCLTLIGIIIALTLFCYIYVIVRKLQSLFINIMLFFKFSSKIITGLITKILRLIYWRLLWLNVKLHFKLNLYHIINLNLFILHFLIVFTLLIFILQLCRNNYIYIHHYIHTCDVNNTA